MATGSSGAKKRAGSRAHLPATADLQQVSAAEETPASGRPAGESLDELLRRLAALAGTSRPLHLFRAGPAGAAFYRSLPTRPPLSLPASRLPGPWRRALAQGQARLSPLPAALATALAEEPGVPTLFLPVPGAGYAAFILMPLPGPALEQAQRDALRGVSAQVGMVLRLDSLTAANRRLETLGRVALAIGGDLDLDRVLGAIVAHARQALAADAAALLVAAEPGQDLTVRAQEGLKEPEASRFTLAADQAERLARPGAPSLRIVSSDRRIPAWASGLVAPSVGKALAALPLLQQGRLLGVLLLLASDEAPWREPQVQELAAGLAALVVGPLQAALHHRETELGVAESTFLLQISQLLSTNFDLAATARTLAAEASDLMESDLCALYLHDPVADTIELAAVQGATSEAATAAGLHRLSLRGLAEIHRAALEGQSVAAEWPASGDLLSLYGPAFQMRSALTVPLRARESLLGFLFFCRRDPRRFTPVETRLGLKLGTLAALAVDNARLYADLNEQMQQVRAAQAQLLEVEKMASLGRIVAGLAHELNNPLAIVSGYAQMLLDGDLNPDTRADLERIDRGARRAAQVVRDLLAFARQQPIMPSLIDVGDMARAVALREQASSRESGIELRIEIDEELPRVRGDRLQLEQVLTELIANARRAILDRPGAGRLTVSASGGDRLRLTVADDGPGIPPHLVDKVFEPFLTTQEVGQGGGLGLAMCYGVVRAHGGRIWATNNPSGGATFHIELPAAQAEETGRRAAAR